MSRRHRQSGFSLIEVLIVVVITAVLAATVITQITGSEEDAMESRIRYTLREMRSRVPVWWVQYDVDNGGGIPPAVMSTIPENPVTGYTYITVINTDKPKIPDDVNQSDTGGWIVSTTTKGVWLNSPKYIDY